MISIDNKPANDHGESAPFVDDYDVAERGAIESEREPDAAPSDPWTARVVPIPRVWYTTAPPARDWLLSDNRTGDGALARGVVGLLAAAGGLGKSQVLAQLAVAIVSGAPWLGVFQPTKIGRVLLVLAEETAEEIQRRVWRSVKVMGVAPPDPGAIDAMGLHGTDCALLAAGLYGMEPAATAFAEWLRERVRREKYDAVLLDPHSRLAGRDAETHNAAATRTVQVYESLASSGASVLVAHHTPQWDRVQAGGGNQAAARGVTGLVDGVRWMLHAAVERLDSADDHLREVVTITCAKSNYARKSEPVLLRRHQDYGGALVPLDAADQELVQEARSGATQRAVKVAQRETERDAREAKERDRRATAAAQREEGRRQRDAYDDEAVRSILAEDPSITVRDLRAAVRARCTCGGDRADAAIRRVRRA